MDTIDIRALKRKAKVYISEDDIEFFLGREAREKVIKYSDLEEYKTIEELLPENIDYVIILIESSYNSGHWVLLLRNYSTIEYFNSYGSPISFEIDLNSERLNDSLDQNVKYLNILLTKALKRFKIVYNRKDFQKMDDNIATCGKWIILRVILFLKNRMNIHQFINFVDKATKKFKLPPDLLITFLVSE